MQCPGGGGSWGLVDLIKGQRFPGCQNFYASCEGKPWRVTLATGLCKAVVSQEGVGLLCKNKGRWWMVSAVEGPPGLWFPFCCRILNHLWRQLCLCLGECTLTRAQILLCSDSNCGILGLRYNEREQLWRVACFGRKCQEISCLGTSSRVEIGTEREVVGHTVGLRAEK